MVVLSAETVTKLRSFTVVFSEVVYDVTSQAWQETRAIAPGFKPPPLIWIVRIGQGPVSRKSR